LHFFLCEFLYTVGMIFYDMGPTANGNSHKKKFNS